MPKIRKYDFCCILVISTSILFWDTKDYLSNLRFLIITVPFFFFYFKDDIFYEIKNNWKTIFIPIFLILCHYFFSIFFVDIKFNNSSILKLFILFLFAISVFLSTESLKKNFSFFINFSVSIFSIFLIFEILVNLLNNNFFQALSMSRFENCYHGFFSQMSFVFKEESHFAFIICPILLTFLFNYFEEKKNSNFILVLNIFILCFAILFALSLTFIVCSIFFSTMSFLFAKRRITKIIFFFLLIPLISSFYFYPNCTDKLINISSSFATNYDFKFFNNFIVKLENYNKKKIFNNQSEIKKVENINTDLSSGVYINAFKISKNSISDFPFGVGFDNYENSFKRYVDITSKESANLKEIIEDLYILNYNDGSNNFAKLTTEFGILSIFFYIILIKFILNNQIDSSMKLFIISSLFTQIFIRGAGYFNGGFLILYFFAFYLQKTK